MAETLVLFKVMTEIK